MNPKDHFVSLRRDMGRVIWSGLQLQPEVDIRFRIEQIGLNRREGQRIIRCLLARPGITISLDPLREFSLSVLGSDYSNLETEEAEMVAVSQYVTGIRATVRDSGIELSMELPEQPQLFWLAAGIEGRWDWFVNPRELPDVAALMAARTVNELFRQAAA